MGVMKNSLLGAVAGQLSSASHYQRGAGIMAAMSVGTLPKGYLTGRTQFHLEGISKNFFFPF